MILYDTAVWELLSSYRYPLNKLVSKSALCLYACLIDFVSCVIWVAETDERNEKENAGVTDGLQHAPGEE
jgi:hypothetical protein